MFWRIFGEELKNVNDNIRDPTKTECYSLESHCDFLVELNEVNQRFASKPDFANYRIILWQSLAMFPSVAEAKTRDVSEVFLEFIQ